MNRGVSTDTERPRVLRQRIHELETTLTPQEMMRHAARAGAEGHPRLADAFRASATVAFLQAQRRLEPFTRRVLSEGAALYAGGVGSTGRSLMVGFCGRADRLMLPLPMFLQHLPAEGWDVLLLKDALRTQFRQGIGGFAASFPELVERVADLGAGYSRCVALGTSMGGLPAVRFALLAGAERGISIGGRPPNDVLRLRGGAPSVAFDPLCACLPPQDRNLLFTYAAGCESDSEPGEALARLTGGRDLPVEGQDGHAVLHGLYLIGRLRAFLDAILNRPVQSLGRSGMPRP